MSIDFSFVEYTAPIELKDQITQRLNALGFVPRVNHVLNDVSLWSQNHTIIMVKFHAEADDPGITGLGFIASQQTIDHLDAQLDPEVNMYVTGDQGGLRVLLAPVDNILGLQKALEENYLLLDDSVHTSPGLQYISGIRYNCSNPRMMDFYQDLGFGFTRNSENYNTLVSKNRRFSIMGNKMSGQGNVSTLICDTDDIFATTAAFVVRNIDMAKYDLDSNNLNFGRLNHKIVGYNCLAEGTADSYTIENFIPEALPNLDIVFRMRNRYLNIAEHTLEYHYGREQQDDS